MTVYCWMCDTDTGLEETNYGDHTCKNCGVMISIYPPQPERTKTMAIDYNDEKYQGKYVYMPRIGEEITIDIKELKEVTSDNSKFNFSENVPVMINGEQAIDDEGEPVYKKKDLGYHVEALLTDGKILSVTSISAFIQVFKKHQLNDGDKVRIKHVDKGVWEVEKF